MLHAALLSRYVRTYLHIEVSIYVVSVSLAEWLTSDPWYRNCVDFGQNVICRTESGSDVRLAKELFRSVMNARGNVKYARNISLKSSVEESSWEVWSGEQFKMDRRLWNWTLDSNPSGHDGGLL